jgi:Ni/Fe-hydrogenase subunit HybB-like protein
MHVLAPLARYIPIFMTLYLGSKIGDMIVRQTYHHLLPLTVQSASFMVEISFGVVLPLILLLIPKVRKSPKWLGISTLLVILGVVLNRLNIFVIAYHPPYATKTYFPSITEMAVSLGLVAALMLTWRVAVTYLPILQPARKVAS